MDDLHTLNKFSLTFRSNRSQIILKTAVLNSHFSKVLLINSISTQTNLLKNFIFVHLLLLESYEQGALQKELIIAPLIYFQ